MKITFNEQLFTFACHCSKYEEQILFTSVPSHVFCFFFNDANLWPILMYFFSSFVTFTRNELDRQHFHLNRGRSQQSAVVLEQTDALTDIGPFMWRSLKTKFSSDAGLKYKDTDVNPGRPQWKVGFFTKLNINEVRYLVSTVLRFSWSRQSCKRGQEIEPEMWACLVPQVRVQ